MFLRNATLPQRLVLTVAGIFLSLANVYAEPISDEDWMAYFGDEAKHLMEYKVSLVSPFGIHTFTQRVKLKGATFIDGKEYRETVVVHDSGPFADQVTKTFYRVSADGLYERDEHGKERLLVPRPLSVGQTWATETETFAFEGIEDFETFRKTVPSCAKITATDLQPLGEGQEVKTVRYYERSKGQIYKNVKGRLP